MESHFYTDRQSNGFRDDESHAANDSALGGCCDVHLSSLIGLIVGVLVGGVALAILLTLVLVNPVTRTSIVTVTITIPITPATTTTTSTLTTTSAATFNVNLVTNGNAESGTCDTNGTITSPLGWTVSGPISQVSYANNTFFTDQNYVTPGPSNRGACYFMGHISAFTSMWQTINLTNQVDSAFIDSLTVKFNLSAWMGGINVQNDSAILSLTFLNQDNRMIGSSTNLGPILSTDRRNISALIFQETTGFVPISARLATVLVAITRTLVLQNNGDIDNIAFYLFQ